MFLSVGICQAANTITHSGNVIEITNIDSDWTWTDTLTALTDGIWVKSIQFNPGATDDVLVIKEGSDTGPKILYFKCVDTYDQRCKYFNHRNNVLLKPVFDYSDSTISAGASIIIIY